MHNTHVYERFVVPDGTLSRLPDRFEPFHARYDAYRPRLRFLTRDSSGCCESFAVDSGLVMLVMDVGLAGTTELRLRGQDIVEFHYRLSGSLELRGGWGHLQIQKPTMLLWRQPSGCDDVNEVIGRATPRETSISLYCDPQWLADQVGARCPAVLHDFLAGAALGGDQLPLYRLYGLFSQATDLLDDIVRNPFEGQLRYLYAKSKAMELLCWTLRMLASRDAAANLPGRHAERDRRSVLMAYEILRAEHAGTPDITRLARRVGINANKLRAGFKQEFGATVSQCLRKSRLECARRLLQNSDLPVGEIAQAVGYKHHSTFTAAFTEYFGMAPKRVTSSL